MFLVNSRIVFHSGCTGWHDHQQFPFPYFWWFWILTSGLSSELNEWTLVLAAHNAVEGPMEVSLWCIKEASLGRRHKLRERGKKGKMGGQRPAVWSQGVLGREICLGAGCHGATVLGTCAAAVTNVAGEALMVFVLRDTRLWHMHWRQMSSIFLSILFYCLIILVL